MSQHLAYSVDQNAPAHILWPFTTDNIRLPLTHYYTFPSQQFQQYALPTLSKVLHWKHDAAVFRRVQRIKTYDYLNSITGFCHEDAVCSV